MNSIPINGIISLFVEGVGLWSPVSREIVRTAAAAGCGLRKNATPLFPTFYHYKKS